MRSNWSSCDKITRFTLQQPSNYANIILDDEESPWYIRYNIPLFVIGGFHDKTYTLLLLILIIFCYRHGFIFHSCTFRIHEHDSNPY